MERVSFPKRNVWRNSLIGRWLRNAYGLIVLFLFLLCILFALLLRFYYYQSVQNALESRADLYQRTMEMSATTGLQSWEARSRELIDYFTDKDKMELQVLDRNGAVLLSSTGFVPLANPQPLDYRHALDGAVGRGVWRGKNPAGEPIMALTVLEADSDGNRIGALRYVVSLQPVNRQILVMTLLMVTAVLLIIFLVSLSSLYFIHSIVDPVTAIGSMARRIATGEYDVRLEKRYDDEIGDLCDTINFMAEEIGATEKLKNDFLSSVSHELRTPLTAIKGWSETLLTAPDDVHLTTQGLAVIGKEAGRLSGLVEELLDFSRMESGRITLRQTTLDVLAELEEVVFLFQDRAKRAGLSLEYCETDHLPPVMGDSDRIKQVFVNILDNAVKYTQSDGRIRVETAAMPHWVQIVISDTGIGISAEDLPKVRQKFYQVDAGSPGSGIGLALADEIVRLHGGHLEIDSEYSIGTTVTVMLPRADDNGKETV